MEFRRVGDALLRAPHSIISSPSLSLRASQRGLVTPSPLSRCIVHHRTFTTTRQPLSQAPQRADDPPPPPSKSTKDDASFSASLDSLFSKSKLDERPPPPSSDAFASAYTRNRLRNNTFGRDAFGTRDGNGDRPAPRHPFGAERKLAEGYSRYLKIDQMKFPEGTPDASNLPPPPQVVVPAARAPRFNASTGRSIELDEGKGRDLVRGLALLNMLVSRNRVKADVFRQRFHERAGLKRKRLRGERWRKRFKVGFQHLVGRVGDLTRKGW